MGDEHKEDVDEPGDERSLKGLDHLEVWTNNFGGKMVCGSPSRILKSSQILRWRGEKFGIGEAEVSVTQ